MDKQEEKKIHWRVFLVAWGGLFLFGLSAYAIILRDLFDEQLSNIEQIIFEIAKKLIYPILYMPDMLRTKENPVLSWIIVISVYSLLIERVYHLYWKWEMKKQAMDSNEC